MMNPDRIKLIAENTISEKMGSYVIRIIKLETLLQFVQSEKVALEKQVSQLQARVNELEAELQEAQENLKKLEDDPAFLKESKRRAEILKSGTLANTIDDE